MHQALVLQRQKALTRDMNGKYALQVCATPLVDISYEDDAAQRICSCIVVKAASNKTALRSAISNFTKDSSDTSVKGYIQAYPNSGVACE